MTAVVMVTMADRAPMLREFLRSLVRYEPDRSLVVHVQGIGAGRHQMSMDRWLEEVDSPLPFDTLIDSPEGLGCHAARIELLRETSHLGSYVNVDDDVLLTEHTHWQPAIDRALEPGNGFVLTNWVRSPSLLSAAVAKMRDEFLPQVMVYQGGGMAYGEDVADLIRSLDPLPARYDDLWPLTAYLAGYRNWRYRGSLSVHSIMQKGGMNAYMRREPRPLLAQQWVNYPMLTGQPAGSEWGIPLDADLKKSAIEEHHRARAERGWPSHGGRA